MSVISLIAAVAENGVIGKDGDLPWRIASEWKYFVRMTKGKPVIMGRKTFESLDAPLKDRPHIVITRHAYDRPGITVASDIHQAINIAKNMAIQNQTDEIMVIGGAQIYRESLPLADKLYLTEVHMKPRGDTYFPDFDRGAWVETKREFHKAQAGEDADYTITVLEKKR